MTLFCACAKEPTPQPAPQETTYDFDGRRYEYYQYHSWLPNERTYYAIDFISESNFTMYNGYDSIGSDSIWYRYNMIGEPHKYAYKVRMNGAHLYLWTYLSDNPFVEEEFNNSFTKHGYRIDKTETYIYYQSDVFDIERTYSRVQ